MSIVTRGLGAESGLLATAGLGRLVLVVIDRGSRVVISTEPDATIRSVEPRRVVVSSGGRSTVMAFVTRDELATTQGQGNASACIEASDVVSEVAGVAALSVHPGASESEHPESALEIEIATDSVESTEPDPEIEGDGEE